MRRSDAEAMATHHILDTVRTCGRDILGEKVLDKISKNENIVFLTSHACNWEWLLLSSELKLKCKINVVYKKLSNRIETNISKINNYCRAEEYHQKYIMKKGLK